ncbi:hypothetical protein AURANDRAFT_68172 [Aureococcus anophagefferens]|uniref:Uncharacterized protein n=1 Tax=Aureococcus anophagefferens TaxID=44056 RepID=F0YNR1_AURAN|nr:hypothetical protein AURANDRAFT_68172 [Aureococcus anophagefferens]EGB03253.1 hypothetical protein AURANDRAFT_68172 [Aureococcus anophagefferens]|eukprot:XP_009042049.1 hypothetical protein AURANDRAFT_68172 [Aureococcus anophagefferens]
MGCPRRLFAAAALWLVTSSQRARPRRDLGASSAATSGQRYKPQRVATYAGPRLGDTVNRSASPLPRPWSACERCGVVTTINPPSEAILRVGNASGWCLVVVGDRKTADGPYEALAAAAPATVAYLSAAAQETLPYGLASATPWDHFARKNLGYLYAIHAGAATIFDFDDDNVLLGAPPASAGAAARASDPRLAAPDAPDAGSAFFNAYAASFGAEKAWPRGLPLDAINGPAAAAAADDPRAADDVVVAQLLANHDPDATLFDRAAFWALLLPASVHGRVADIWRGFVAQRVLRAAGLRLAFLPPGVTQLRNDHDALADYMSERPLYEKADAVVRVLDGVAPHRPGGSVARAVEDAYVALYEHGLVALDDVAYAQLWLADLYAVGLALPKLRRHKARHRPVMMVKNGGR